MIKEDKVYGYGRWYKGFRIYFVGTDVYWDTPQLKYRPINPERDLNDFECFYINKIDHTMWPQDILTGNGLYGKYGQTVVSHKHLIDLIDNLVMTKSLLENTTYEHKIEIDI